MNKKTAFIIGGSILFLGVSFIVYKKIKQKRLLNKYNTPSITTDNSSSGGSSSSSSSNSFDPTPYVEKIHKSMKGFGTDDNLFFDTANGLTAIQRGKVKDAFNSKYGDLKNWIEGDFSMSEEKKALALFGY